MIVASSLSSAGFDCSSENSWMPAGRPARNSSKRSSASLEPQSLQRLQRVGVVDVAGEDEVADA
jgi:hypothetical protein